MCVSPITEVRFTAMYILGSRRGSIRGELYSREALFKGALEETRYMVQEDLQQELQRPEH